MSDALQFYPTPLALAEKAWSMFKDKDYVRVLEPSAGNGDLLAPYVTNYGNRWQSSRFAGPVDVIEVDAAKHPLLQAKGAKVVGFDFLEFTGIGRYSHVVMNPPFAQGAQHLLHAWEHLYDGEIVCILNAETLRNPFSKERQHLLRIVQQHGRVEYAGAAFADAERQTEVEVALVHLVKRAQTSDLVGDLLGELSADRNRHSDDLDFGFQRQLALPKGLVEDAVLRFDAAVAAAKGAAQYQAKANYYAALLGRTFHEVHQSDGLKRDPEEAGATSPAQSLAQAQAEQSARIPKLVRAAFSAAYDELKDRAWLSILRSTEVLSKLSSRAQKRIEAEFELIKSLDFTAKNIYGFLHGLSEAAGSIQLDMVLDVFDDITRYHEDNVVFYMGWKSNGRHRTAGMRLKTTRFILPGHGTEGWHRGLSFDSQRELADFDKVFAMLDGKHESATRGLCAIFGDKDAFERLRKGSREQSDYFEVRYYPKRGTIHFFPRSKELMDRLNRVVGKHRKWLPPRKEDANADFHAQYEQAEKFDAEFRESFSRAYRGGSRSYANAAHALGQVVRVSKNPQQLCDEEFALECVSHALDAVMDTHGLSPTTQLSYDEGTAAESQVLLLAA